MTDEAMITELTYPTDQRVFAIADAFYNNRLSVDQVWEITRIDKWYLSQLHFVAKLANGLLNKELSEVTMDEMLLLKRTGLSSVGQPERTTSSHAHTSTPYRIQRRADRRQAQVQAYTRGGKGLPACLLFCFCSPLCVCCAL